jgi:hypothetical protein
MYESRQVLPQNNTLFKLRNEGKPRKTASDALHLVSI